MKKLHISDKFSLPLDAVTQTFAVLAKRRAGKSYTASVMAEELVDLKQPFVVLDPTSAWWGLRATESGKPNGSPVIIIGGTHGDIPLEATAGKVIADLVVDNPGQYIIDLGSTKSNAEQDRFVCDFAEHLYRRKATNTFPLHLFLDEADSFAPQRPMPGQQRMLGAIEALVRRGGIRGIGLTLITQRPAVLNKNVLTQTECLIVLQITAPQDINAIDDWVKNHSTPKERDLVVGSLASLQRGEAWIWSPGWLQCIERVQIRKRHTFNSSATPEVGKSVNAIVTLAPADIEHLRSKVAATIEKFKLEDPKELQRTVSQLQVKLAEENRLRVSLERKLAIATSKPSKEIRPLKQTVLIKAEHLDRLTKIVNKLDSVSPLFRQILDSYRRPVPDVPAAATPGSKVVFRSPNKPSPPAREPKGDGDDLAKGEFKLTKCNRAVLTALAQYPQGRLKNQVALLSGYSVNSGSFANALAELRTNDLITRGSPIQITAEGSRVLGEWKPLPTGDALFSYWLGKLGACSRKIMEVLKSQDISAGMSKEDLSELAGYSANSGSFANSLSELRTLELIHRGSPIRLSDDLFQ